MCNTKWKRVLSVVKRDRADRKQAQSGNWLHNVDGVVVMYFNEQRLVEYHLSKSSCEVKGHRSEGETCLLAVTWSGLKC